MLESGSFGIVPDQPQKGTKRAQMICKEIPGLPLRLCAFAGKLLTLLVLLNLASIANAQPRVTISILNPGELKIEAEKFPPSHTWSFRNAYANALGVAERVHEFKAFEDLFQILEVNRIAVGEYRSKLAANKIAYSVKLSTPISTGWSHVSWLAEDRGYLMLADLVPMDLEKFSIRFDLPAGWTVESSIAPDANGQFKVSDPVKAVFFVGRSLRKVSANLDGGVFDVVLSGKWSFKDSEAVKAATRVMQKYVAITRFKLVGKSMIMISPPPIQPKKNEWWAETRGSTAALLIDPRGDALRGQLNVILAHELLHLWVPNSLKLAGDYDWFFEGFTLYMALRMALELDVIKFKEFLNTLGRAYDTYLSQPDDSSLIEASERRWTTGGSQVYVKGMLVAFLYDLLVRKDSSGKTTLEDRYRELFSTSVAEQEQGNEVIIRVLGSSPAMVEFTRSYIERARKVELERVLPAYGLQLDASGKGSQLGVSRELSVEQRQLLRSLGYRN
jgi:hypothetical protein